MPQYDLGRIVGEQGIQGKQGIQGQQGVQGQQGIPGATPEFEAGTVEIIEKGLPAEFNLEERDGKIYINLRLPLERDMGGDMKKSIYDKNNKAIDLYQYIDENDMTLKGGTFTGDIFLNRDPIGDTQAATKKYVDTVGKGNEDALNTFIEDIKMSLMNVERTPAGEIVYDEKSKIQIDLSFSKSGEASTGTKELIINIGEVFIDGGNDYNYIKLMGDYECKNTNTSGTTSGNSLYLVDENDHVYQISGGTVSTKYTIKTPGKFKVQAHLTASRGYIDTYTITAKSITATFEKKII